MFLFDSFQALTVFLLEKKSPVELLGLHIRIDETFYTFLDCFETTSFYLFIFYLFVCLKMLKKEQ